MDTPGINDVVKIAIVQHDEDERYLGMHGYLTDIDITAENPDVPIYQVYLPAFDKHVTCRSVDLVSKSPR